MIVPTPGVVTVSTSRLFKPWRSPFTYKNPNGRRINSLQTTNVNSL